MMLYGELACLGSAFLWAITLNLMSGPIERYGARVINLAKCGIAAVMLGITVLLAGQAGALLAASPRDLTLVGVSGLLGLVLGDTALFASVARLGVHRSLLLQSLAPVFTALLAAVWLGERLTAAQGLGAAVILAGVLLVVAPGRNAARSAAGWSIAGILFGLIAAFGQGSGVVVAKEGMAEIPTLSATFLRLAASVAGLVLIDLVFRRGGRYVELARDPKTLGRVVPATFLGTYVALYLMMAGVKFAPAAIAAVLLSTPPVFSLVIESVLERRLPTLRGVVGTALAVSGVAILVVP